MSSKIGIAPRFLLAVTLTSSVGFGAGCPAAESGAEPETASPDTPTPDTPTPDTPTPDTPTPGTPTPDTPTPDTPTPDTPTPDTPTPGTPTPDTPTPDTPTPDTPTPDTPTPDTPTPDTPTPDTPTPEAPPAAHLVVSEFDVDQPGVDGAEFIELIAVGGAVEISSLDVQLVNGNGGEAYATISLSGAPLSSGAHLVLTDDASVQAALPAGVRSALLGASLQNGPDAVRVVERATGVVHDEVAYGGDVEGAGEGTATTISAPEGSVCRLPNGNDTDDNAADFVRCNVTPGAQNVVYDDTPPPPSTDYVSIEGGIFHFCGVRDNGEGECWGFSDWGQLNVPASDTFTKIVAGELHSCGLRTDQTLRCWGKSGLQSQPPSGTFLDVSAGDSHSCGVRTDRTVECWGYQGQGQLDAPTSGQYQAVVTRDDHTCALTTTGAAVCWGGYNDDGDLGPFTTLDASNTGACGVTADGEVRCWGELVEEVIEVPDFNFLTFVDVAVSPTHVCGVTENGFVACWGTDVNEFGYINLPENEDGFTNVAVTVWATCAVQAGGVQCWGRDQNGMLSPPD